MINYEDIIQNLTDEGVKQLLTSLEIPFQEKDEFLLCKTMCHNTDEEEASWKLYYYKDTHLFYCYTECSGMSIFKFLRNYYETQGIEYNWHKDILEVIQNCSVAPTNGFVKIYKIKRDKYAARRVNKELEVYPKELLKVFTKYYPAEWLEDGITPKTMEKFDILFSPIQNKIIIPHYNINNELVGIRGRALNKWEAENVGKYMPVQIEEQWYAHSLSQNLYGLNMTADKIREKGICYVGEGEKFVLQMESFSLDNCSVAVCGNQFNKMQLNLLLKHCKPKEIVLCFDKEENGFDKMHHICQKYKNYCNFSFINDRANLLNLKESPTDRGEQVFTKILEKRVKI